MSDVSAKMRPLFTLGFFIACVSAAAATGEKAPTPDGLAKFYCRSMHEGAFLSTKGIENVLRVSSPAAERLFDGYGAPDVSYLIESSTITPRTLTSNLATYKIAFSMRGMLSATSIDERERTTIVEELVIEKNENGTWAISHFTPIPMASLSSAIRGLKNMRGFSARRTIPSPMSPVLLIWPFQYYDDLALTHHSTGSARKAAQAGELKR